MKGFLRKLVAAACLTALPSAANAVYTVKIEQVGADVVMTGAGSLDIRGLTQGYQWAGGSRISYERLVVGSRSTGDVQVYYISDSVLIPDVGNLGADSETGPSFGVVTNRLYVPLNYVSGSDLGISTGTYRNTTIAQLGYQAGAFYSLRLSDSERSDTFDIAVGEDAPAVPEPATWAMMLGGFGAIGTAMRRRTKPALA